MCYTKIHNYFIKFSEVKAITLNVFLEDKKKVYIDFITNFDLPYMKTSFYIIVRLIIMVNKGYLIDSQIADK